MKKIIKYLFGIRLTDEEVIEGYYIEFCIRVGNEHANYYEDKSDCLPHCVQHKYSDIFYKQLTYIRQQNQPNNKNNVTFFEVKKEILLRNKKLSKYKKWKSQDPKHEELAKKLIFDFTEKHRIEKEAHLDKVELYTKRQKECELNGTELSSEEVMNIFS